MKTRSEARKAREVWKPVPSAPGYEVSNEGRVRSWHATSGFQKARTLSSPKLRKLGRDPEGYVQVGLIMNGKLTIRRVHHLVLETFVGPRPNAKSVGRHLDGKCDNNVPSNLAWGTQRENIADAFAHGTIVLGARHPFAKLTNQQVRKIRQLFRKGKRVCELARLYGVSNQTISRIKSGVSYADAN